MELISDVIYVFQFCGIKFGKRKGLGLFGSFGY